ncbi:hypothetical protein NG799_28555 [Laspinema sp. D1]|uniref:AAA+ ATPase domain-containing protein n=1 Tax=Laspinema palackyanum D2a TaxID=2953684 RepID=A0ABT2MZU3_9CYAN|nr:hypothetical protein [Laspinema sp. D2a]
MSLSRFLSNAALMATAPLLLSAATLYGDGLCSRKGDQIYLTLRKSDFAPIFTFGGIAAGAIAGFQFYAMSREEKGQTAPTLQIPPIDWYQPGDSGFYDWRHLPEEATGIFLAGDPGSGKTALVQWLLGLCTEVLGPSQLLIFDTHNHDGKWPDNAKILSDEYEILESMRWMLDTELKGRKQGKRPKTPLIWVCDELGDLAYFARKKAAETKDKTWTEVVPDFLICAGSQGRKYEIMGVFINQGANVTAVGLEGKGDYLESYHKIFLGRLTAKWGAIQGIAKDKLESLSKTAYPCLVGSEVAIHPTHGHYGERKKKQPPKPLVNFQAQTLPLPSDFPFEGVGVLEPSEDYPPGISNTPDPLDYSKLFEVSSKHGWISASKAKAFIRALKPYSTDQIREIFQQLHNEGHGYIRGKDESLEWRLDRVE